MPREDAAYCSWGDCIVIIQPGDRGWFDQVGAPKLAFALCVDHLHLVFKYASHPDDIGPQCPEKTRNRVQCILTEGHVIGHDFPG